MFKGKKILAYIPARGGSKGVKNKNIRIIQGKPLIYYTIKQAQDCGFFDDIVVSTDSVRIANVAKKCGGWVPFMRPAELAADTSKTIDGMVYTINQLKEEGKQYDLVVLLQVTSPLRTSQDITEAVELCLEEKDDVVSVCREYKNPLTIRTIKGRRLTSIMNVCSTVRRQDLPEFYRVDGAIYINWVKNLKLSTSLADNKIGYIIDNSHAVDIDNLADLKQARVLIRRLNKAKIALTEVKKDS